MKNHQKSILEKGQNQILRIRNRWRKMGRQQKFQKIRKMSKVGHPSRLRAALPKRGWSRPIQKIWIAARALRAARKSRWKRSWFSKNLKSQKPIRNRIWAERYTRSTANRLRVSTFLVRKVANRRKSRCLRAQKVLRWRKNSSKNREKRWFCAKIRKKSKWLK